MLSGRHGRIALAWVPAVLYMAAIWIISSLATPPVAVSRFPFGDKGLHFLEYAILGLALAHATFKT
jgi:hypothetical protein